jgi:hypothetical protein
VEGATGPRRLSVYVDEDEVQDLKIVVEDKEKRRILN